MSELSIKIRLSLRCALVVLTLFCVSFGWLHHRARSQKIAVEKIVRFGGKIRYDWDKYDYGTWYELNAAPTVPTFLRQIFGDDYFFDVISVDLTGVENADLDEAVIAIGTISSVRFLDLQYQPANYYDLSHISKLVLLQDLNLSHSSSVNIELRPLFFPVPFSFPQSSTSSRRMGLFASTPQTRKLFQASLRTSYTSNCCLVA